MGAGFTRERQRRPGTQQRVQDSPGRPKGDYKHKDPQTGQPIPATVYYKRIRQLKREAQQQASQVDIQQIQQYAKRGIPPQQATQIVNQRQFQSVGVPTQIQNGNVVPITQNEMLRRQLALQEIQRQQQFQQIQRQMPQQVINPSNAVRPIWRRQNQLRYERDAFGNVKQVQGGNDPRIMIEDNTLKVIVTSTVLVILAVAFLTAIATQTNINTQRTSISGEEQAMILTGYPLINETAVYTVTNAPTGWKIADCPLTNFVVANKSGDALTLTTDYTVDLSEGTYSLVNNDDTNTTYALYGANNKTYVSYDYCDDNYVSQSWARTVLTTNVGLYALAILAIVILLVYSLMGREYD